MTTPQYRIAPPGFTTDQWQTFLEDGIITIENALSDDEVDELVAAVDRVADADDRYKPGGFLSVQNFVERDPALANLIDHDRHVGYVYDVYGELLKLHLSEMFLRARDDGRNNKWHPDGARALPYQVFSPVLPLQIKIGYWLTDLPHENMGNFVYKPGSHLDQYMDAYDTHDKLPDQEALVVPRGTMTIMHGSIWHMVQPNHTDITRKNLFLAYCPAWITNADRLTSDPAWLETLNREQRIIMRSYDHAYANAKPPASEFPLFLDRETGEDHDPGRYGDHVLKHRRKRETWQEKQSQPVLA